MWQQQQANGYDPGIQYPQGTSPGIASSQQSNASQSYTGWQMLGPPGPYPPPATPMVTSASPQNGPFPWPFQQGGLVQGGINGGIPVQLPQLQVNGNVNTIPAPTSGLVMPQSPPPNFIPDSVQSGLPQVPYVQTGGVGTGQQPGDIAPQGPPGLAEQHYIGSALSRRRSRRTS